jgi:hypothetical protein
MAYTINEDGSSKKRENKNRGHVANKPANMPAHVYESIQRQYGPGRGYGKYTIEDKKNVINWHKLKGA